MKIKNYIVENYQLLMACLEEELCKNGISYVRIDNEIHFLDQIIRFYDIELDKKVIINWAFMKEELEISKKFKTILENITLDKPEFISLQDFNRNSFILPKSNYQIRNKSIQKYESIKVNQKLKKYSK